MKIKEIKEPKNKEELQKTIKNRKFDLMIGRLTVCIGVPSMLAILEMTIKNANDNFSFIYSIFMLGAMVAMHYRNLDDSSKIAKMEDQLSKMEEGQLSEIEEQQENTEDYTRSLSK